MLEILKQKSLSYRRFIRLTEFDQSTPEGERDERYRRALLSSATMVLNRGLSLLCGLFTIYIAVGSLGPERFAAWNTIVMALSLIAILDCGIPASLVNRTAQAAAIDDTRLSHAIASNIIILFAVSVTACLICFVIFLVLPWARLLNTNSPHLIDEVYQSALISAPILFIQIFNTGLSNIVLGLQRGFLTNIIMAFVNLFILASTWLAMYFAPNPAGFMWATQGSSILAICALMIYLVRHYKLNFLSAWRGSLNDFYHIWALGKSYLSINIFVVISSNLDILLASSLLNSQALSELVTVQRLFQVFIGIGTVLVTPLWAAYADAFARSDHHFISTTLWRSLYLSSAVVMMTIPLAIVFSKEIFSVWTQGHIIPDIALVALVAFSATCMIYMNTLSVYLNGCGLLRPQVTANLIHAILAIGLKFLLALHFGIYGIVIGGILAFLGAYGISYLVLFRRLIFRRLQNAVP